MTKKKNENFVVVVCFEVYFCSFAVCIADISKFKTTETSWKQLYAYKSTHKNQRSRIFVFSLFFLNMPRL